jgi:phosphoribosylanthranilate isomerase
VAAVAAEVKFCGLTRAEDARAAAMLGARYTGVIFAPGPRRLSPQAAATVLDGAGGSLVRVGVFATTDAVEISGVVHAARLDIVQIHADVSARDVRKIRERTGARVWAVLRISGAAPADRIDELDGEADAIVFDTLVGDRLGGTGRSFDWSAAARGSRPRRSRLVVAGGLTPGNVAQALAALAPDIVDVSSGVEERPGVKDHERMRVFADAVRGARGD